MLVEVFGFVYTHIHTSFIRKKEGKTKKPNKTALQEVVRFHNTVQKYDVFSLKYSVLKTRFLITRKELI